MCVLEMATNSRGTLSLDEVVKMLDIECDDEVKTSLKATWTKEWMTGTKRVW